ncbi:uncharacterized protein TNIN_89141 [Trichonephila inaurata madagascariensis]|uniref:Uncharacterized protein n=1 Tax=Trichonephila inaurata madagascariensis TaxID=2747483 RepID=A0A8X7CKV7_9ARAC|nr:uncharacterized protein TNIN_89141 [Trichonephila inaurata madagascariensis]
MQESSNEFTPDNVEEDCKDDSWEDLAGEIEKEVDYDSPKDSVVEYCSAEDKSGLQRLPSFEVLNECPFQTNPDFLKVKESVFTQQQTTFAIGNMASNGCPLIGLTRKVHKEKKWLTDEDGQCEKDSIVEYKKLKSKNHKQRKSNRSHLIMSASGLVLALFATNIFTFVLGFSLGWWTRDSVPTLAVYEFHLDPALL